MSMPERIGESAAFAPRGGEAELEVVEDRDEALEEGGVGVFDRVVLVARGAFAEVVEIGLAAQREVAEAVEIGLQLASDRRCRQSLRVGATAMDSSVGCAVSVRESAVVGLLISFE